MNKIILIIVLVLSSGFFYRNLYPDIDINRESNLTVSKCEELKEYSFLECYRKNIRDSIDRNKEINLSYLYKINKRMLKKDLLSVTSDTRQDFTHLIYFENVIFITKLISEQDVNRSFANTFLYMFKSFITKKYKEILAKEVAVIKEYQRKTNNNNERWLTVNKRLKEISIN
jgi:hypothetical protein